MGFLGTTAKILDSTVRVLNEAAFGDVRNIFNNGSYRFRYKPIGLFEKNYDLLLQNLMRNIGNAEYSYDGFGTPIGELANPFYNTIVKTPWFYSDNYKNSTSNYIEYVAETYGASLSIENINEVDIFKLSDYASKVGFIDGAYAIDSFAEGNNFIPNPNATGKDTSLGLINGYYLMETFRNAVATNDVRKSYGFSITKSINDYFGINPANITDKKTYRSVVDVKTGRFLYNNFSPITDIDSPLVNSNYGNSSDLGSYTGYYNYLSDELKEIYNINTFGNGGDGKKLYYPSTRDKKIEGKTYLDSVLESSGIDELKIRYKFNTYKTHSNISDTTNGGLYVYSESEFLNNNTEGLSTNFLGNTFNSGVKFGKYTSYGNEIKVNDLLKKTNDKFKNGEYDTLIARFHTKGPGDTTDITQTAISEEFGMSHGRNLLKLKKDYPNNYENPYCRVWTFHHQYKSLNDTIRPLPYKGSDLYGKYGFSAFTADHGHFGNGRTRLDEHGVLNKNNGLVNITPIDTSEESRKVSIKNCMFSIENLAWKDAFSTDAKSRETFQAGGLSAEQKGPFGGRIMWFPPYDLKFNEDVSVNWNETNFIGRGEGIYTYTNTTRTGNLSFKILVDHPSIINYWENRGRSNSSSVDAKEDPEQELLRFFAGCDMLTSKPTSSKEEKNVVKDPPIPSPSTQVLTFFVFYPNNYSGVDDDIDFAMAYLTNGLGAGMVKDNETTLIETDNDKAVDYQIPYAVNTVKGTQYGGYEMRPEKPISIVGEQNMASWIGEANIGEGEEQIFLYAQEGKSTNTWWQRKWYYRVDKDKGDKDYESQKLKKENYIDSDSFCLNSSLGASTVAEKFKVEDTNKLFSLADVYVALEKGNTQEVLDGLYDSAKVNSFLNAIERYGIDHVECIGKASTQGYEKENNVLQQNRANTIKRWLSTKSKFDSAKIVATTGGTGGDAIGVNEGNVSSLTNKLWRCAQVNIHLKAEESKTIQAAESEVYKHIDASQSSDAITTSLNSPSNSNKNSSVNRIRVFNDLSANKLVEAAVIEDRISSIRLNHLNDNINGLALNLRESVRNGNVNVNSVFGAISNFVENEAHYNYDRLGFSMNNLRGKDDYGYSISETHDNAASDYDSLNNSLEDKVNRANGNANAAKYKTVNAKNDTEQVRYDNEAKFFYMLEKEEPFLHHKISDKIKYFDPAFHSISPEGFNARLTFLHQCTRQGPTVGGSDNHTDDNTANNLSFGRPPVCVLRIGDFYYTKILIDSISITFDPLVWDLNTEGIGVMPMIADINMRFKFIGGSSLAGHITRLQNALSFNYYANTEVYDNRSELAQYDENGNIEKFSPYNPTK